MLRYWALFTLLCATAATAAPPPSSLPPKHFVEWTYEWGDRTIEAAGLTLKIEPRLCGDRRPVSEACWTGSHYVAVTIEAPGMEPVSLMGEAGVAHYVGVGKLGPTATRPSVFLITEDGGSAGCVQIDVAVPEGAAYRTARLNNPASLYSTFCEVEPAKLAWPRDITGNGRAEFLLVDEGFHCAFTSCAASWYPPRVIALQEMRALDVSKDPALAPLFRADMAKARLACEHEVDEAQGACAGFAADAARLGLLERAWPVIEAQVRRGCRVKSQTGCPFDNFIPATFPAELHAALLRSGYISGS